MKSYTKYICEVCGKESSDIAEIRKCEASHHGLTLDVAKQHNELIKAVEKCGRVVSITKNADTNKAFDDAVEIPGVRAGVVPDLPVLHARGQLLHDPNIP